MIYLILAVYFYGVIITYLGLDVANAAETWLDRRLKILLALLWFIFMPIGLVALVADH